jgi:glycosyl hydrolase family 2
MADLDELDVFYGELTVNRALVYARLPRPTEPGEWSLTGQVRGPRCLHAQTLPSTAPLVDQGLGPTLLARAIVPDPSFWSADLPAIYDVAVSLHRGTEVIATARTELGFRSLGIRGQHFALAGKRWVLRAVGTHTTTDHLPRAWHDATAALLAHQTTDELLAEAAQWGAFVVADIVESAQSAVDRIRALACCPAVAMVVMRHLLPPGFRQSDVAPNLLLGQAIEPREVQAILPWAQFAFVPALEPALFARNCSQIMIPIVAVRPLAAALPIAEARAACDVLQRDLAPIGQFAGYVV